MNFDFSQLTDEQIKALTRLDAEVWFVLHGVCKDKEGKKLAKRKPNIMQRRMFAHYRKCVNDRVPCWIAGLKPRQVGLSTVAAAITYHHMRNFPNLTGALMADKSGTSDKVFEVYRTFAEEDTFDWGPGNGPIARFGEKGNLTDEIMLPNGSSYRKETAGSARAGAGGTLQVAIMTEVAHFPVIKGKDPALGFLGSWAKDLPVSLGIMDSTPNGPTGLFYETWMAKDSGYQNIFSAWFEFEEHSRPFASEEERQAFIKSIDDPKNKDYLEREEMELYKVSYEQLNWRRRTIKGICRNDINKFRQEYPSDDISCFLLANSLRFKSTIIKQMAEKAKFTPCEVGEVSLQEDMSASWTLDEQGTTRIWEHPRYEHKYWVSMDTCTGREQQASGGNKDPDYHSIGAWREEFTDQYGRYHPPKLVAHHYSRLESAIAASIAAAFSIYYGKCMVVPEVNNCGLYHVETLMALEIPVFHRTINNTTTDSTEQKPGWLTQPVNKKTMIDRLASPDVLGGWSPENPTIEIYDPWIIEQLAVFVKHKDGSYRAMNGKHDDGVMMVAIALQTRSVAQPMKERRMKPISAAKINKREGWRTA